MAGTLCPASSSHDGGPPREIGLLFVATTATQKLATLAAKTCNLLFFHMPLDKEIELASDAFPISPAELGRGQIDEFHLNHVVLVDDPLELVRIERLFAGDTIDV